MEIKITELLKQDTTQYSNSVANSGREDIGRITWINAQNSDLQLVNAENFETIKSWLNEFSDWEIQTMEDYNALFIQFVSAEINENDLELEEYGQKVIGDYIFNHENDYYFQLG